VLIRALIHENYLIQPAINMKHAAAADASLYFQVAAQLRSDDQRVHQDATVFGCFDAGIAEAV
jgi:hypothetical protein